MLKLSTLTIIPPRGIINTITTMMKFLKKMFIGSLILAVAGSVFFCLSINQMSLSPMSHDMATTQNTTTAHILHVQELTSAAITGGLLFTLVSLFFLLFFISSIFLQKLELFIQNRLLSYFRFRKRSIISKIRNVIHYYLSLFVRSPAFIHST